MSIKTAATTTKDAASLVAFTYVTVIAAKGLYDLGRDWKDAIVETRKNRKNK